MSCGSYPGDFWVTTERLILAPMTTAFANDAFSLVVNGRSTTATFWKASEAQNVAFQ